MKIKILVAVYFAMFLSVSSASESETSICAKQSCAQIGEWEVGVALGIGGRSNPLVGGDNIPLIVMPDIAYYGEAFYFDNFELGYQFQQEDAFSMEVYVKPNTERAFFSFWHPENLFLTLPSNAADTDAPDLPGDTTKPVDKPVDQEISVNDVEKRDWALDAGLRWQYYTDKYRLSVLYAADISSVHDGFYGGINVVIPWSVSKWNFASSFGTTYKNKDLINYYYGVSEQDTEFVLNTYTAEGGWQYNISTTALYPFSQKWQFLIRAEIIRLHDSMYESPLVKDKHVASFFSGMVYRF